MNLKREAGAWRRAPVFQTMGHTKATPENQRPTLLELEIRDQFTRINGLRPMHAIIRGCWSETEVYFEIQLKGDFDDVTEVFETLKDNGNLMGLEMHEVESESGAGK